MKTKTNIIYVAFALFALACFALSRQAQAVCQRGCGTDPSNTFLGNDTLMNNTTGHENTAIGNVALLSNTTGSANVAVGSETLKSNTTGIENTAVGNVALQNNTTASFNTATGSQALWSNTTGDFNTATGHTALASNTIGFQNTANGSQALISNTEGYGNVGIGFQALNANTTGYQNTAIGQNALFNNSTGSQNISLGQAAGVNLTTGNNNIDIGNLGVAGEAKTIRIGTQGTQTRTFIAGISGASGTGMPVVINANGRLGTAPSSARFKDEINPMDKASETILALKPVTFRYKKDIDPDRTPQFGLVAEQVAKVNPDLVTRDPEGKAFTVRYDAVNAMLLNEFLKAHQKIEEQEATIAKQQKQIQALTAGLKEQASQIQKVSAQIEMDRSTPKLVLNRP